MREPLFHKAGINPVANFGDAPYQTDRREAVSGKLVYVPITTRSALPAWSQRLISELESADVRAERLARDLSHEQFNWHPAPGAWSIGQCLEHLRIGNEIYLPAIANSLDGRQQSPVQDVILGAISRWFIHNYIGPSVGTRAKAPRKARPAATLETSILDAFLRTNQMARTLISRASAYDVNRIRFRNPFVPLLRFTVGTGLEIVSQHESRHLLQAERVRQSPGFPRRGAFPAEIIR